MSRLPSLRFRVLVRWTPHPVIVTMRDNRDYIRERPAMGPGFLHTHYFKLRKIVGMQKPRPHGSPFCYIKVLLYSDYTTITGWGVLLRY